MRSAHPPRIASWLLECFGVDEGLVGDLAEEYDGSRSKAWFWRQTAVAVMRKGAADVRQHKRLALRALIVGWAAESLIGRMRGLVLPFIGGSWAWQSEMWLNAHLGFPVIPLPILITRAIGAAAIGWLVARVHRPRAMSMLLVYLASLLLFEAGGFVNSFERALRSFGAFGLALNSLFPFLVVPACMILGGLLSMPSNAAAAGRSLPRQTSVRPG